jgi:hypothetical protein
MRIFGGRAEIDQFREMPGWFHLASAMTDLSSSRGFMTPIACGDATCRSV